MDGRALVVLVGLSGCVVAVDDAFCVDEPVDGVVIDLDNGDVRVEPGERLCATVELGGLGSSGLGERIDRGVLFLDYGCEGLCGGEITVQAPPELFLDVELGAGDLSVEGRDGPVWARVGAGALEALELRSPEAELAVGSGDLTATFLERPGSLDALVAAGSARIEVPSGGYLLELEADAGAVSLDGVFHDEEATDRLHLETSTGEITVRGIGAEAPPPRL